MDKSREMGANSQMYQDVAVLAVESVLNDVKIMSCVYGLSGKELTPQDLHKLMKNCLTETPKMKFNLGVNDDLGGGLPEIQFE